MSRTLLAVTLLIGALTLSACYTQSFVAPVLEKPATLTGKAAEPREYEVVKHFMRTKRSGFWLFALIQGSQPDLNQVFKEEISSAGGDAVMNVEITTQFDALDVLVGLLVGGIYNSKIVHIEGDVVRYKK